MPLGDAIDFETAVAAQPFRQNGVLSDSCFSAGTARVFRINRYRYYVRTFAADQAPYLMLDTGTDLNGDNTLDISDHLPLAAGVEDLQVAYVLASGTVLGNESTDNEPVRFADNLTSIASIGSSLYLGGGAATTHNAQQWPSYDQDFNDSSRQSTAAANIRMVRISISTRSLQADPSLLGSPRDNKPTLENHDPSGKRRISTGGVSKQCHLAQYVVAGSVRSVVSEAMRMHRHMPHHKAEARGYALIVSLMILLISTMVGVAAINVSGIELDLAGMQRRDTQLLSCAEAGRQLLQSHFQFGVEPTTVVLDHYYSGSASSFPSLHVRTGYYTTGATGTVEAMDAGSFSSTVRQTANLVNGMRRAGPTGAGQYYRMFLVCTYTDAANNQYQKELEYAVLYAL